MNDQFAESAKGAEALNEALGSGEEALASNEEAVSNLNDTLGEHQQVAQDAATAQEAFGGQIEETAKQLKEVPHVLDEATQGIQSFNYVMDGGYESTKAFTEQYNNLADAVTGGGIGESNLGFVPETLSSIGEQAHSTSAAFSGLAVSTENANKAVVDFLGNDPGQYFSSIAPTASEADQAVSEFLGNTNTAAKETGGIFDSIFGEGSAFGKVGEGIGGFFGGIGQGFNDLMMGFDSFMRPLMYLQMGAQMAQSVGSWIYNANLAAEGPNASNPASFTSQVNQLGQSAQQGGNQFAVGFGAGLNPSINAWNNQNSQSGGGSDFWGGLGRISGGIVGGGADILQVLGGSLLAGLSFGNTGMMQTGTNWENSGMQGLVNMYDAANGLPLQYPGTIGPYGGYIPSGPFQRMALSDWSAQPGGMTPAQANVAADWAYFNGMPTETPGPQLPGGGYSGGSPYTLTGPHAYTQPEGISGALQDIGGGLSSAGKFAWDITGGGIGQDFNTVGSWWHNVGQSVSSFFGMQPQTDTGTSPLAYSGGCFVAGTPILLPNGTTKPIETLQKGEQVIGYDGTKQHTLTILACMTFPAKQTYQLSFSDGRTLTTSNSHPIATAQGWKSLSPNETAKENPGLEVSVLEVGDTILTMDGTCTLVAIEAQQIERVYNFTVDGSHTYYANGILVHNIKGAMTAGSMSTGGTGTESVNLSHTFTANVTWEANNLEKQFTAAAQWAGQNLTKAVTAAAQWTTQGITKAVTAAAEWTEQNVQKAVTAVANWTEQNVQKAVTAVANWTEQNVVHPVVAAAEWTEQNVQHAVQAVANWTEQNVQHAVTAAANWTEQNVIHPVTAAAKWAEANLEHDAVATAKWTGENLEHTFVATANWIMGGMAGFAEGTSSAPGGVAMIAEAGSPEVVEHNGHFSLFDSPAFVNLPAGSAVYPLQEMSSASPRQFASGTVGDVTPISLPIAAMGGAPQTANIHLYLDSQTLMSVFGVNLAQNIRVGMGLRSY